MFVLDALTGQNYLRYASNERLEFLGTNDILGLLGFTEKDYEDMSNDWNFTFYKDYFSRNNMENDVRPKEVIHFKKFVKKFVVPYLLKQMHGCVQNENVPPIQLQMNSCPIGPAPFPISSLNSYSEISTFGSCGPPIEIPISISFSKEASTTVPIFPLLTPASSRKRVAICIECSSDVQSSIHKTNCRLKRFVVDDPNNKLVRSKKESKHARCVNQWKIMTEDQKNLYI